MGSRGNEWVRIFDIPETSQHKKGFTIYKVISMLYPEQCPDAITKITVWKRYNEFKKLHRELKGKYQSLRLKDKFPVLPNQPYFKRFNKDVIRERKESILNFLEYVGREPALFTSHSFVKFFESSHTPNNLLNGSSINSIRADLQLPSDPEYTSFFNVNSEDEHTLSDTDSISTMSSLSPSVQTVDLLVDPSSRSTPSLNKKISSESLLDTSKNTSVDSRSTTSTPTPPLSPNGVDYSSQYIIDAAQYITRATELEIDKQYDEAFVAYKQGIDILLKNVKQDKDINRKEMVRFKIEKYLLRAEKIYHLHLSPEMKSLQELSKQEEEIIIQTPLTELYRFKVIKLIENGMLVMHADTQQLLFVKVVYKTLQFSKDYLMLPDNVPYMVKLHQYYNCENAIFLILEYSCGKKLTEHLKSLSTGDHLYSSMMYSSQEGNSDNESEGSYSDLINEYTVSKSKFVEKKPSTRDEIDSAVCKREEADEAPEIKEIDNIISKSQQLITSMELSINKQLELSKGMKNDETDGRFKMIERKMSDRSMCDDFEVPQHILKLEDIVRWSAQLLLALEKLHILGVTCCDLNMNNLLIDENGDLLLTYTCAISEERIFKNCSDICLAPELYTYEAITCAVDWWCYGAILYELLVGMPLRCVHPEGITSYGSLKVPKYVLPEGRSLLKQLLIYEPKQRLGCGINGTEDIKTHPFFNSISWEQLASRCI